MRCVAQKLFFINRENEASLAVLPDLLSELDAMDEVPLEHGNYLTV